MTRSAPARKSLGQNFLIDRSAVERIVRALELRPEDAVLEIGPGRGALTGRLLEASRCMAAVELDALLARRLRAAFPSERLMLFHDDILRLDLATVRAALRVPADRGLLVAGNLPYNISKPVALKLVREREHVERAVLMFQREVAERLTAVPGNRDYAPLTVLAGAAFTIRRLFDLPGSAFRPRPRVISTVTLWQRKPDPPASCELDGRLRACLAACFAQRRQTLRNNLRRAIGAGPADRLLEQAMLDGSLRAERVPPSGFRRLADLWERP